MKKDKYYIVFVDAHEKPKWYMKFEERDLFKGKELNIAPIYKYELELCMKMLPYNNKNWCYLKDYTWAKVYINGEFFDDFVFTCNWTKEQRFEMIIHILNQYYNETYSGGNK